MFVYYADFIDLHYFKKNICIARNYIIISGAAGGRREYNKGHDRIYIFWKWEKTRRRIRKPKNNITMAIYM